MGGHEGAAMQPTSRPAPAKRPYRGDAPETRRRERRSRLVQAGLELIGSRGLDATHIGAVCSRARVATRYFYESFASKEALLLGVLEHVAERARRVVVDALAEAPDEPRARLDAGLRAFVHAYLDDPRCIRVALVEATGRSTAVERQHRRYFREFASLIAEQAERFARSGRIRLPAAPERVGLAMAGMIRELLIDWTTREDPPSADALADEIMALFDVVLRGARPETSD